MTQKNLHSGRRARMREKFTEQGKFAFHPHELLEMLLYYIVPQRDTNETAKMLIDKFSSLDDVFNQPVQKLTEVAGVGERVAKFICDVGELDFESIITLKEAEEAKANSFTDLASFFVNRLSSKTEHIVTLMLLNNSQEPVFCEDIYCSDYGAASVKPARIVELAVRECASAAVLAHNHPFGAPYPTPQDIETNKSVKKLLSDVGVALIEHYIVSGKSCLGFMNHIENREAMSFSSCDGKAPACRGADILEKVLSYQSKDSHRYAQALLEKFKTIRAVCEADVYSISKALGGNMQISVYIKLIFAIASVRICDKFKFGRKHTEDEICKYLKALMLDFSDEAVYLLSLSADGKIISSDPVSRGTVNFSEIVPRRVIEIAQRRSATEIIIAHNHPGGKEEPSDEDIEGTAKLSALTSSLNIKLINHYIIAGGGASAVLA